MVWDSTQRAFKQPIRENRRVQAADGRSLAGRVTSQKRPSRCPRRHRYQRGSAAKRASSWVTSTPLLRYKAGRIGPQKLEAGRRGGGPIGVELSQSALLESSRGPDQPITSAAGTNDPLWALFYNHSTFPFLSVRASSTRGVRGGNREALARRICPARARSGDTRQAKPLLQEMC